MCVACRLEKTLNPYAPTVHETGFGIPANIGTVAGIALDSPVIETIDFAGDRDWFRITLQAGVTYAVALTGGSIVPGLTLSDPVLGVYDRSGSFLAGNDDGSFGLDSFLTFTAGYTGTHYLEAAGFVGATGS